MALASPPSAFYRYFPIADFVDRINWAWIPGLAPTSWWRSWAENLRVGGSTNPVSQHLVGTAADVVGPQLEEFERRCAQAGLITVRGYGASWEPYTHAQLWERGRLDTYLRTLSA